MIKKTYYNLPEEKRKRIFDAVKDEFSTYTNEKASINRIVKKAGISRGSFYQYFDDKLDLVQLLTGDIFNQILELARQYLIEYDGNVFLLYPRLFSTVVDIVDEKNEHEFLKNIFINLRANGDLISDFVQYRFNPSCDEKKIDDLVDRYINPRYLNCSTREDIFHILNMLNLVLKNGIFNIFVKKNDKESEKLAFSKKVELLKQGLASEICR